LFNFLLAKKYNGTFIVRIEDTDLERSSRESEANILDSLRWLGITWNEGIDVENDLETFKNHGPYRQTERLDIYNIYIDKLLASGQAYKCYCSEEELEAEREGLTAKGETPRYLGKCRNLTAEQQTKLQAEGRKASTRFRVPEDQVATVHDLVRGEVNFETNGIGDYIIVKSDGIPTYNFAVVIDDVQMEITHVVRGEEHLSNTPRQILLYKALGLPEPTFAHVSLILGKDRTKMSKRHGSTSVVRYKEEGYLPQALINFLALLGWAPEGEEEIFTMEQLIEKFSLDRVSKSPAVFDMDKLQWMNGLYLRQLPEEEYLSDAMPYIAKAGIVDVETAKGKAWAELAALTLRDAISCLSEITDSLQAFTGSEVNPETDEAVMILKEEHLPELCEAFIAKLPQDDISPEEAKKILKELTKELGLPGKKVFMPLRVAITGQVHGRDLDKTIALLGPELVKKRLENVKQYF
jgi:nondiscriminating glutamyl-tRNA synthetase